MLCALICRADWVLRWLCIITYGGLAAAGLSGMRVSAGFVDFSLFLLKMSALLAALGAIFAGHRSRRVVI